MSFEENIKKWVALDNQLKTINEKQKQLRDDFRWKIAFCIRKTNCAINFKTCRRVSKKNYQKRKTSDSNNASHQRYTRSQIQ